MEKSSPAASCASFFNSGGVISLKFPNLSSTTCPCGILFIGGGAGFIFLGESGFFGGGSFSRSIALRTLTAFSVGGNGGSDDFFGGGESSAVEPNERSYI